MKYRLLCFIVVELIESGVQKVKLSFEAVFVSVGREVSRTIAKALAIVS